MKVRVDYAPISEATRRAYPDVAYEVYVPDGWTDEHTSEWYEQRHSDIHHQGFKAINVVNPD